jgi:hypothetical protein
MNMSALTVSPATPHVIYLLALAAIGFVLVTLAIDVARRFRPDAMISFGLQRRDLHPYRLTARDARAISLRVPGDRPVAGPHGVHATMPINLDLVFCLPEGLCRERIQLEILMPRELTQYFRGAMVGHRPQRLP